MLKKIPPVLSPDLLKIMMEMGHGDEIVLADGNYYAGGQAPRIVRADGLNIPVLLEAILEFFPLDPYVDHPVSLMEVVPGDTVKTPIWDDYRKIIQLSGNNPDNIEYMARFSFYERARNAYATVMTGEKALYANILLKKGVITDQN